MLLLVRRPKWVRLREKGTGPVPMTLVEFDDGSHYLSIRGAMFLLRPVEMKKPLLLSIGGAVDQKHFISKFNR